MQTREQRRAYYKAYYWKHRVKRLEQAKECNKRIKQEILEHYSIFSPPACARCKIDDTIVLTIDHINGGGHQQLQRLGLQGGRFFYRWLKDNGYPEGYQVLCFNCNVRKHVLEGK